jgi:hypothetical protein
MIVPAMSPTIGPGVDVGRRQDLTDRGNQLVRRRADPDGVIGPAFSDEVRRLFEGDRLVVQVAEDLPVQLSMIVGDRG